MGQLCDCSKLATRGSAEQQTKRCCELKYGSILSDRKHFLTEI
jgi:hypothetical protein